MAVFAPRCRSARKASVVLGFLMFVAVGCSHPLSDADRQKSILTERVFAVTPAGATALGYRLPLSGESPIGFTRDLELPATYSIAQATSAVRSVVQVALESGWNGLQAKCTDQYARVVGYKQVPFGALDMNIFVARGVGTRTWTLGVGVGTDRSNEPVATTPTEVANNLSCLGL